MSELGARVAHRRMMKVVKLEARETEYAAYSSSQQAFSTSNSMAPAQATASPTSNPVAAALPTSTAVIAGVGAFLALLVIGVAGGCFWRRRRLRAKKAHSSTVQFNRDVFAAAEKKSYGMQGHVVADLSSIPMASPTESSSPHRSPRIQHTPTDSDSSSTYAGWKPQVPTALRVTNQTVPADISTPAPPTSYPSKPPKALSKKHSFSQKNLKQQSMWSPAPEDMARSPPPAYDFSNGAPGLYHFPSISGRTEAKQNLDLNAAEDASSTLAQPPSRPASHKPKKLTIPSTLAVPEPEHNTLPSPARSESFAPKELAMPGTSYGGVATLDVQDESLFSASSAFHSTSTPTSSGSTQTFNSSMSSSSEKGKLPRMMTVAAAYTPTLPDELRVTVGDTVRLLQEYKDGWGFVQYVGKIDSPKGVVPMVCLQERKRMVPTIRHKTSTGSSGSVSSVTGWR